MSSTEKKYGSCRKCTSCTSKNVDTIDELVLSRADASGTRGTVHHFDHKKMTLLRIFSRNLHHLCQSDQMVIKVAISVINSDKLNRIYDNLYLRITFIDLFALKCVLIDWVSDDTGVRGLWRKAWRSSLHKDQVEQHVEERLRFFSTMALYKFTYFVLKMLLNTKQPTTG